MSEGPMLAWDIFLVAGLVPPLAVWLLWRMQRLSVEFLRRGMVGLVKHSRWLYHTVSWTGTFLHELSHAIVLIVTGLGVKDWSVGSEQGHVTPRRIPDTGLGAMAFIVAALAPMFFVPALLLVAAILLLDSSLLAWGTPGFGVEAMDAMSDSILGFPVAFVNAIGHVQLQWQHMLFLLLMVLGAPGTRPSFVRGGGLMGGQGDIGVVRAQIRMRPWIALVVPVAVLIGYYAILPLWPAAYWWPFQALWATALVGIVTALLTGIFWATVARHTRTAMWITWLPVALTIGGYWAIRVTPGFESIHLPALLWTAVAAWVGITWALSFMVPRRDKIDRAISHI